MAEVLGRPAVGRGAALGRSPQPDLDFEFFDEERSVEN